MKVVICTVHDKVRAPSTDTRSVLEVTGTPLETGIARPPKVLVPRFRV